MQICNFDPLLQQNFRLQGHFSTREQQESSDVGCSLTSSINRISSLQCSSIED